MADFDVAMDEQPQEQPQGLQAPQPAQPPSPEIAAEALKSANAARKLDGLPPIAEIRAADGQDPGQALEQAVAQPLPDSDSDLLVDEEVYALLEEAYVVKNQSGALSENHMTVEQRKQFSVATDDALMVFIKSGGWVKKARADIDPAKCAPFDFFSNGSRSQKA